MSTDLEAAQSGPSGQPRSRPTRVAPWRLEGISAHIAAAGLAVICGLLRLLIDEFAPDTTAQYVAFIPAVVSAAIIGGAGPAVTATLVSAIIGWFLFADPSYSLFAPSLGETIGLLLFIVASAFVVVFGRWFRAQFEGAIVDIEERKTVEQALRDRVTELQTLMEMLPVAVFMAHDKECTRITANAAGAEMLKLKPGDNASLSAPEAEKPPYRLVSGERELTADELPMQIAAAEAREVNDAELDMILPDGERRTICGTARPLFSADGKVRGSIATFIDITERRAAERELHQRLEARRESEERFRVMADSSPLMIWVCDAAGGIKFANRAYTEFFGITRDEAQNIGWQSILHPSDAEAYIGELMTSLREGKPFRAKARVRRADGKWRWIESLAAPRLSATGTFDGMVGSSPDITSAIEQEQHLQLLVNELNHRVKNTLASVQSIASQSLRDSAVSAAVREAFEGRLITLARAHDLITSQNGVGAELGQIIEQTLEPFKGRHIRIDSQGPEIRLSQKSATAFSMAVHELATNALKYGALSTETGRVDVEWHRMSDGNIGFRWQERGGPLVVPPRHRGFGSRLIERGLASELEAKVHLDFQPAGVVCSVMVPASATATEMAPA